MITELLDCGHPESEHNAITRGYGTDKDGKKYCYQCCADQDRQEMIDTGKTYALYLSGNKITNWPRSLVFEPYRVKEWKQPGFYTYYPVRLAHFIGPDGRQWSIKVMGNMDCGRAKRLKR